MTHSKELGLCHPVLTPCRLVLLEVTPGGQEARL